MNHLDPFWIARHQLAAILSAYGNRFAAREDSNRLPLFAEHLFGAVAELPKVKQEFARR